MSWPSRMSNVLRYGQCLYHSGSLTSFSFTFQVDFWRCQVLSLTISSCSSKVTHRVTAQYVVSKQFSEHVRFSRSCKYWSEFARIDQCSSKIRIALNELHLIVQLSFCSRVKKSLLVRSYVALGARILSLIPLRTLWRGIVRVGVLF